MSPQFYKATRMDGFDFFSWTIEFKVGKTVYPNPLEEGQERQLCGPGYLHVATAPSATLVGGVWPCRLFLVEGEPEAGLDDNHPFKAGLRQLKVLEELPSWQALGPNGKEAIALIERARLFTDYEAVRLAELWEEVRRTRKPWEEAPLTKVARTEARAAAAHAARDAAWDAPTFDESKDGTKYKARLVCWYTAEVLVIRDLIGQHEFTQEDYDALTGPWREVIGKVHPEDL